jgi:hypothetical protein
MASVAHDKTDVVLGGKQDGSLDIRSRGDVDGVADVVVEPAGR